MKEISIGTKHELFIKVEAEHTAVVMGSGDLPVLATPAMIAGLENAAKTAVLPYLGDNETTVGTLLEVSHKAATAVGRLIRYEATVAEADGRRLVFAVSAHDDDLKLEIGGGRHERFVVDKDKFMAKIVPGKEN